MPLSPWGSEVPPSLFCADIFLSSIPFVGMPPLLLLLVHGEGARSVLQRRNLQRLFLDKERSALRKTLEVDFFFFWLIIALKQIEIEVDASAT